MKERKPGRHYFTINIDEPYAPQVFAIMKQGEQAKGTWPEGDISFEEWREVAFPDRAAASEQRIREQMIRQMKDLANDLPEGARDAYLLYLESESFEERIAIIPFQEAKALMTQALDLHKTLKESGDIISSEKRFGTFLVEQGLATAEQVIAALAAQKSAGQSIETLSCEQQMLTPLQVLDILNAIEDASDLFFRTAVELGYLAPEQVEELHALHQQQRPQLGEVLVRMGVLDRATLEDALQKFFARRDQLS